MAQNIFDVVKDTNLNIEREYHDLSHTVHSTYQFGYLYPFMSTLVPQNSKLDIETNIGAQFLPMMFPVQTPMSMRVSYFKVPLRTLWKDYKDYVGNFRKGLQEPFLDFKDSFSSHIGVSKLGDYLNVPVVSYGNYGTQMTLSLPAKTELPGYDFTPKYFENIDDGTYYSFYQPNVNAGASASSFELFRGFYYVTPLTVAYGGSFNTRLYLSDFSSVLPSVITTNNNAGLTTLLSASTPQLYLYIEDSSGFSVTRLQLTSSVDITPINSNTQLQITPTYNYLNNSIDLQDFNSDDYMFYLMLSFEGQASVTTNPYSMTLNYYLNEDMKIGLSVAGTLSNYTVLTRDTSPYYDSSMTGGTSDSRIKLKAYRARAYESVYNAYYRDIRNNPYYLNGEVQYNVYLPTTDGGADTCIYELHRANWEKDFLTTAVPSPQQGIAPLVGLTTYTTRLDDGTVSLNMAVVDESGKKYSVSTESDADGLTGIKYTPLSEDTPVSPTSLKDLYEVSYTSGISIPDLRVVNAYQKFLELNMRKGYSYRDIIEGRFDCKVRYDDLQMPEFIGGFTRPVSVNRVVQSVETSGDGSYSGALGSLAGDAFISSSGNPTISCFFDEECILLGIVSFIPRPIYSQLLPKDYLYNDLLDHFQPEFAHLGFQPITYAEVAPLQSYLYGKPLTDVFGYQRPWYEYVQQVDTCHGLFLTQLRNFLMHRTFDQRPVLTESFLLVDPEQINDVFSVTNVTDKIMCRIDLTIDSYLPIPRNVSPRLD